MSKEPEVSLFQVQLQPYLYLSIETNQKNGNNYLFLIDTEYGGINSASIPGIDLNHEFNSDDRLLHSDEFLVGAYFKTNKEKKQDLIICTANTQKSPNSQNPITINISDHLIYKINKVSFYNVSKDITSSISRPDLYFSPDFDLTSSFPYTDNTVGYSKVLDNNNKFCWNKELIRPFSKFYGNPCIIILQGNVDRLFDGEPDIVFLSKFMQINPFDLNLEHKEDKDVLDDEIKCQCELIFPPIGNYSSSSHLWMIVKTKHKDKKYFNESGKDVVLLDISNKFKNEKVLDQYKDFSKEHSHLFNFSFNLLFSDYNANTAIENQNQQTKIFYLIGDNIIELINSSFLYICKYVSNFQHFSRDDSQIFSSGTDSRVEIPIKKDLLNFFQKSIYHTGKIYNNGNKIQWIYEPEKSETSFHEENNDLYKFNRIQKSEKFILDSRHVSISYFNPADRSNLIKVKAHFQDEFIISQISINLRHRNPSQIITMEISFDEDTLNHHIYCPQVPLPNPNDEETYTFNLRKIAKDSLLYPVDYKCLEKTRFLTLNFINYPKIEINTFIEMIQESDLKFIVKRPINKKQRFEIIQNKVFKEQDFLFGECLDIYRNKKDKLDITNLRDIETTRIENGISNYERCLYFVKNNTSPSLFDFRSYIDRSKKTCPFCGRKLSSSNQVFYEENSICSILIHYTENQSSKSFAICNDCNNKYKNGGPLVPIKSNITSSSIRTFINKNHKFLINVNEFIDLPIIEIPYQTDPQTLISQNASVYGHSFEKYSRDDIQNLLSVNSSSSIKFGKEAFVLLFFQTKVNIKKIMYTKSSDINISLKIKTPNDGVVINTKENPISFQNKIECKSVQLTFIPDGEVSLEKIKIFGDFLLPNSSIDDSYTISGEVIQYSQNRVLLDCKQKFEDKFNTVQIIPHTGVVKGYRIQIKKGFKICSLIFAFFKKNVYITHHCVLLPDKLCAKNNDNKVFYIPYEFNDPHDSIKIFYLDRQPGDSVNIKIDTVK